MNPNTNEVVANLQEVPIEERKEFLQLPDEPGFNEAAKEILAGGKRATANRSTKAGRKLIAWAEQKKEKKTKRNKRKQQRKARRKNHVN